MNIWELNRGFWKGSKKGRHGKNDHQYVSWNLEGVSSMSADDWWRVEDSLKYQIQLIISCHPELCPRALGSIVCMSFWFLPISSIPLFYFLQHLPFPSTTSMIKTLGLCPNAPKHIDLWAALLKTLVCQLPWRFRTLIEWHLEQYWYKEVLPGAPKDLNIETKHMLCMCW